MKGTRTVLRRERGSNPSDLADSWELKLKIVPTPHNKGIHMEELIYKANIILKQLSYKKKTNSFWKLDDGFYKLISFQNGAHGGGYFFVNVCVHPLGLPELLTNQFSIIDHPKEYECILRQRIEQIVIDGRLEAFRQGLVSLEDEETIQAVIDSLPNDVEKWLVKWGSYETIAYAKEDELANMLTVIPKLKKKAVLMLKFFCTYKIGDKLQAMDILDKYLNEDVEGITFPQVDKYLMGLMEK